MTLIYREVKGTQRKLAALAKKHDFPYAPGDKVFRRKDSKTGEVTIRAYRVLHQARKTINVQRVRRPARKVRRHA